MVKGTAALLAGSLIACASVMPAEEGSEPVFARNDPAVRIALSTNAKSAKIGATGGWTVQSRTREVLGRGTAAETMTVEMAGTNLAAVRANGSRIERQSGPLVIRTSSPASFVTFAGKRYRGDLSIHATDSGMLVVNRLPMEEYLRGVVPLEIGPRREDEAAAVQAQAVAARSYSYSHLASPTRLFDMYATVQDQVYGGADAEKPLADASIVATRGMVLKFAGRVLANTPYHSTCGGSTAATTEVWYKEKDQPFLRSVSDQIPGTDRFYCDPSPRFRWTRTFTAQELESVLEKYLSTYTTAPRGPLGAVRSVREVGRTPSGRLHSLSISTDRGTYTLRGNDIRFVLRSPKGEILNSTSFRTETEAGAQGVTGLTATGGGYGHGIGMCQWGAIGRARAGQDYRKILTTYYPGTTVEPI